MTDSNARFLGSIPELYDRHLGPVIFRPYAEDLAQRLTLGNAERVLETACGTGILTQEMRARLPRATRLTATDLNEPMLAYAIAQLAGAGPIEWQTADAAALPFPSNVFDAVACQFGAMFVPDKEAAFREARRVLTEGGRLAFNVWDGLDQNPFAAIANRTIDAFFPADPPNFYRVPMGFNDPDLLQTMLRTAGFTQVELRRVKLEARSDSAQSFAVGLVKGNPVSLAIAERGGSVERVVEKVTAELARAGGDRPFCSTMQALVVTARAGGTQR